MFLAVGLAVFPEPKKDSLPFVGESSEDGVTSLAFGFLLFVVGFGPEGGGDGLAGPFDEGLSPEFVTGIAAVDVKHSATLFGDGSDAAEFLDGGGVLEGVAVGAEEGEKSGGEGGASSGEGGENRCVLVLGGRLFDKLVESLDAGTEGL